MYQSRAQERCDNRSAYFTNLVTRTRLPRALHPMRGDERAGAVKPGGGSVGAGRREAQGRR